MPESESFDFSKISGALAYFRNFRPDLFAYQSHTESGHNLHKKMLTDWYGAGSPEKMAGYLDPVFIRRQMANTHLVLKNKEGSTPNVSVERLNAEDYKIHPLKINYSFSPGRFGKMLLGSTSAGICFIGFADDGEEEAMKDLSRRFPSAVLTGGQDAHQLIAVNFLANPQGNDTSIKLHLKGTPFRFAVWKELLRIPFGGLVSYGSLTNDIKNARAVGTAVGDNPVAYLIPCHRVVRGNGAFGPYFWGANRKAVLISWEALMSADGRKMQ